MTTIPTPALVRRGMELISNLVAMIDARASLSLRSDMAEFIAQMIAILDSANHNNAAVDAVAHQLRERLCVVHKLSLYPQSGPQLNRLTLKEFKFLSELIANQIPPSTIVDLHEMRSNLTSLIITNSGIVDIADVLTPHAPKKLRARLPPIILQESKIAIPMKYCWTNLTKLSLSNCGLVRMDEAFHFFPFLTHLDLSNNDIIHVVHLHDCVSLESLNLSYNRIRVLSNLERVIGRVKKINLAHNDIESLDGLDKIYALEKINLAFNYIDDMAEVRHLCRLPNLEAVYLSDNPIAELASYRIRFYREFIVHGTIMNGNRPFPSLDRIEITKKERKKLRKLMFRAPVDAMRESSYHDSPEDHLDNDYYEDEDEEDGGLMPIDEETGEEVDAFDTNRDSFFTGRNPALYHDYNNNSNNRYSMRLSVDRNSSAGIAAAFHAGQSPQNSPTKVRQSSVIAPQFFRTISSIRPNSTAAGLAGPGGGFMAKRKYTKRIKRIAVIADSDEPEVYPKLQEVLTQIAAKKEQELQLQRAREVMEKAMRVIQQQQEGVPSQESKRDGSLSPAALSTGTRTPPNRLSVQRTTSSSTLREISQESGNVQDQTNKSHKKIADFPIISGSSVTDSTTRESLDATTNRRSLKMETSGGTSNGLSSLLLSSSVPDAILFPRDLDPKLRVSEPFSLPRNLSREFKHDGQSGNNKGRNARISSSSSGGQDDSHNSQDALLLASMDPYIGDPQYTSLNILDNLELYFREQVFNPKRPSYPQIYLHEDLGRKEKLPAGLQHAMCLIAAYHPDERLVTMFCEKVINLSALETSRRATSATNNTTASTVTNNADATSSLLADDDDDDDGGLPSNSSSANGNNNLRMMSPEKAMALVLSDQALYFISMDEVSPTLTFADAPVFTVLAHYPLYQLSACTIYFGFQRCALTFSHPPTATGTIQAHKTTVIAPAVSVLTAALSASAGDTSATFSPPNSPTRNSLASNSNNTTNNNTISATTNAGILIAKYIIITREKSRTYPVITRVPQIANQIRNHHQPTPLTNVKIENKDSQLIEQVMRHIQVQGDHDIVYYQMCFQTRSKAPNVFLPRSVILTQSLILLCFEELTSSEVQLQVLESWKLKDIHKIAVDDSNNMQVILTFAKRTNVIGNRKKWRITTDSRNASNKLLEELRRACNDLGNTL